MNRTPVNSSNVASVGYEAESSTLEVEFTNGNLYQYFDVPAAVFESVMASPSIGTALNQAVKGQYRYARI